MKETPLMIDAQNLLKTFKLKDGEKIHAVNGVDLAVKKGEIFSLLGPNGAGKSTIINLISGLIKPTAGDAKIGGYSIRKQALEAKKLMGVVPQEIALYPMLSARQNLAFFGQLNDLGGATLKKRIDEVLDFIELADRADDKIETFSGGMKRRVNLAVGLLHRPQLVYLDEPTVGIDPQSRRRILDTVFRLRDEYDMTVLYTTHLMEEAEELSDRIGIIDHGKVIGLGTLDELTQRTGEEDWLVFNVGETVVDEAVLRQIEQQVASVTSATYSSATIQEIENGSDDGQAKEKQATGTQAMVRLRSGQTMEGIVTVMTKRGRQALPQIIGLFNDNNVAILSVEVREPDLEAVFLSLTGRALRD